MDRMVNEKSANNQITPEEAYECRETSMLLHELIDELPEEQRQCILLYYMEEYSIKDIADVCKCSENTIKSRLNYGKKKLEEKTIELQKKGYVLRGVTPVYLITWLLKTDMGYKLSFVYGGAATSAFSHTLFTKLVNAGIVTAVNSGLTNAVGSGMNNTIQSGTTNMVNSGMTTAAGETISGGTATVAEGTAAVNGGTATGSAVAGTAAKGVASTAVKGGIHTLAGKIITGALATVIAGGLVTAGVVTIINNNKTEDAVTTEAVSEEITTEVTTENPQDTQAASEETTTEDDGYTQMTDDDYADLICGGLSKKETEIMLECLWLDEINIAGNTITISEDTLSYFYLLAGLVGNTELSLETYDELSSPSNDKFSIYYTDKINNILEALQIPSLTSNNYDYWCDILNSKTIDYFQGTEGTWDYWCLDSVNGNIVIGNLMGTYCSYRDASTEIVSGKYNDTEMRIVFKLYRNYVTYQEYGDCQTYVNYEEAVFYKNDVGKYYLSEVHEYTDIDSSEDSDTGESLGTWKSAYKSVLENDEAWGVNCNYFAYNTAEFFSGYDNYNGYATQYALISLSENEIPYLIINRRYESLPDDVFGMDTYDTIIWYIYQYSEDEGLECICESLDAFDGYQLAVYDNRLVWIYDSDDYLSLSEIWLSGITNVSDEELAAAKEQKDQITYYDISDTSAIDNY